MSDKTSRTLTVSLGATIAKVGTTVSLSPRRLGILPLQKNLEPPHLPLDHFLTLSRNLVQETATRPLRLEPSTLVVSTMLARQQLLTKSLAVSAFWSGLAVTRLLTKLPTLKLPDIGSAIVKMGAIDWRAMRERDERALRFASQHNWFIQPETPCDFAADIGACGPDVNRLDEIFSTITRKLMPDIRMRLLADFPHRASLLNEIFCLHGEGRYLASIPLTLMCAEGVALDVSNNSIFNTKRNRPEIAAWLDKQVLTDLAKVFLSSLSEPHPMSKRRPGQLCRHEVLHGRAVDYGTERNSLQAIALLGMIGWTFASDGLITEVANA